MSESVVKLKQVREKAKHIRDVIQSMKQAHRAAFDYATKEDRFEGREGYLDTDKLLSGEDIEYIIGRLTNFYKGEIPETEKDDAYLKAHNAIRQIPKKYFTGEAQGMQDQAKETVQHHLVGMYTNELQQYLKDGASSDRFQEVVDAVMDEKAKALTKTFIRGIKEHQIGDIADMIENDCDNPIDEIDRDKLTLSQARGLVGLYAQGAPREAWNQFSKHPYVKKYDGKANPQYKRAVKSKEKAAA